MLRDEQGHMATIVITHPIKFQDPWNEPLESSSGALDCIEC